MSDSPPLTTAPTWAEISRSALESNIQAIRDKVGDREIWCAVKANAYGHGAVIISRWLKEMKIEGLCVARCSEGQELRDAGIEGPIALLTPFLPNQAEEVIAADLQPVITRRDQIEALKPLLGDRTLDVHLKVDTGMGRVGVLAEDALEFAQWIGTQGSFRIKGLCSHFPVADEPDKSFSRAQIEALHNLAKKLKEAGVEIEHLHIANSAGIIDIPKSYGTLVRPGIMIYGLMPGDHLLNTFPLTPVMTLKTRVVQLKTIHPGTGVSYGLIWTAPDRARIATLAIGYADGLPRACSNALPMAVRGELVPQVGRICMDMCMINVSGLDQVAIGDEVTVWGPELRLHVDKWAELAGTINYEMTTRIGPRVPRIATN